MTMQAPGWANEHFSACNIQVDDEAVPYLAGGHGPPLLMVHGLNASLDWWQLNAPPLARQFRVYLVDLPGFGRLRHIRHIHGLHDYASWLARFMDAIGLQHSHFIGLSMGADIVIQLAAQFPERADRIVLVAPMSMTPGNSVITWAVTGLKVLSELPLFLVPLAIRDGHWATLTTVWKSSRNLIEEDVSELLPRIRAETLILCSSNDPVLSPAHAESILDTIPRAGLTVFPGAGHLIMLSHPDQFNQRVADFLTGCCQARGRP
jgi:pimeloyl-ACP methyl ester carboxylesterase